MQATLLISGQLTRVRHKARNHSPERRGVGGGGWDEIQRNQHMSEVWKLAAISIAAGTGPKRSTKGGVARERSKKAKLPEV